MVYSFCYGFLGWDLYVLLLLSVSFTLIVIITLLRHRRFAITFQWNTNSKNINLAAREH